MDLKDRFYLLYHSYIPDEKINHLWGDLYDSYTETNRKYHNLEHLKELFNYYDAYENLIQNKEAVCFAIFYHDIVYEVWKKNNEEKSAETISAILLGINFPIEDIKIIEDLIICTKNHTAHTPDQCFMIDFDLAILGQSHDNYNAYSKKIRREYKIVPDLIYNKGRKKVLHHFLKKETIYQTSIFTSKFETPAKLNLSIELAQL